MAIAQVTDRIYMIPSILGLRRFAQWLVVGDDGMLLIDSGVDGTIEEHVSPALAEIGRDLSGITQVVISHADVDHYGGNAALARLAPRARLRAHPLDRRLIESWEMIGTERYGWYRPYGLDYAPEIWDWLCDAAGPDTPLTDDVLPGATIDLGGISVEVLGLPGHSLGHLGVWHEPSRTAIVMDAVMGRGLLATDDRLIGPPPYVTISGARETVATLRALDPARLGTSHYAPIEGDAVGRFLDDTDTFLDGLKMTVSQELTAEPQSLDLYWRAADEALGPFPEMTVELARTVGAQLEAFEQIGIAVRDDSGDLPRWRRA